MPTRTFRTRIAVERGMCVIPLPFDPKAAFGRARAPVTVTINRHTYRSTVFTMGGPAFVPLRRSNREAAGIDDGDIVTVRVSPDTGPREIVPPADLLRALRAARGALAAWTALSYTHQREHVEAIEGAKKPETRSRRIQRAVQAMRERA